MRAPDNAVLTGDLEQRQYRSKADQKWRLQRTISELVGGKGRRMHPHGKLLVSALAATLTLPSCVQRPAAVAGTVATPVSWPIPWPDSLTPLGDGYPASGASCRRVGESAATIDFLDHTTILVGCPTQGDAMQLGGKFIATVDGITLVSVPLRP